MLDGLLERARLRGEGLLVHGEPGIGKTALVRTLCERVERRGLEVLATTGVQAESDLPFAGFHQLLHPILGRGEHLPHHQRDALLVALGLSDAAAPHPYRIALAALELLTECAAARPLLVVAEDAHWLDRPTCDALAFVARRLGSEPIALVVTHRPGTASALDGVGLPELHLGALPEAATSALVASAAPHLDAAEHRRVLEVSGGNPLAALELSSTPLPRVLEGDPITFVPLPERLEQAFTGRLADLGAETRALLLVAALDDGDRVEEIRAAAALVLGRDRARMRSHSRSARGSSSTTVPPRGSATPSCARPSARPPARPRRSRCTPRWRPSWPTAPTAPCGIGRRRRLPRTRARPPRSTTPPSAPSAAAGSASPSPPCAMPRPSPPTPAGGPPGRCTRRSSPSTSAAATSSSALSPSPRPRTSAPSSTRASSGSAR